MEELKEGLNPLSRCALAHVLYIAGTVLAAVGNELRLTARTPDALTAQRLKVTAELNAAELLAVHAPEGRPRVGLRICLPDRTLTAEIASKLPCNPRCPASPPSRRHTRRLQTLIP
jgi:hypothetical protein